MNNVILEDEKGGAMDEQGNEVVEMPMDVDYETFPLENVMEFGQYSFVKPPEKESKKVDKEESVEDQTIITDPEIPNRKTYRRYKDEDKERFFYYYTQTDMSTRAIAKKLNIPPSTAQTWAKQNEEYSQYTIIRRPGSGRPAGRLALLNGNYEVFLVNLVDENAALVLD
ncbi:hypothetical protein HPULCUR_008874 [Helicostylum pulchrum]|uniref:Uncharacterized protein n=1 Tax=Helicostylum pulchrum TaxID=562976 RepID=A0ABP9Y9G8_9FUNG